MRLSESHETRSGFSLTELIVSISLIGLLIGLLLPAIHSVRESARKVTCQNNLRQLGLAINNYESAHGAYPIGSTFETQFSWAAICLPYLEQNSAHQGLEFKNRWDSAVNREVVEMTIPLFQCPSSLKDYSGLTDYSGISGSWLSVLPNVSGSRNGMLFEAILGDMNPVRAGDVTDGLSQTLMVAESAYLLEESLGLWACGESCISHDDSGINNPNGGNSEIASFHSGGANAALCDGSVRFLTNQMEPKIVGAYCTRNQGDCLF